MLTVARVPGGAHGVKLLFQASNVVLDEGSAQSDDGVAIRGTNVDESGREGVARLVHAHVAATCGFCTDGTKKSRKNRQKRNHGWSSTVLALDLGLISWKIGRAHV